MSTRSEELRRRGRRIFWYSMLAAVAVHVLIFAGSPDFETQPLPDRRGDVIESEPGGATGTRFVDVFFGPPAIRDAEGVLRKEPPDRVLEARAVDFDGLRLSFDCRERTMDEMVPVTGHVRLSLDAAGSVTEERIEEGSGDPCRDQVLTGIAAKVTYEWLPDDRFPAPVELVQPMRVVPARAP